MPNLAEGASATVTAPRDSTLSIQNPSGFGRVSTAAGVTVWEGGRGLASIELNAGGYVVTAVRGSLYYELASDPAALALNAAQVSSFPGRFTGPAMLAAIGDSTSEYATLNGATVNQICFNAQGTLTWCMAASMGALWMPLVATIGVAGALVNYNRGASGETAEQGRARMAEIDALPVKPRFLNVWIGTNNLVLNTSQSAEHIAATVIGICEDALARGICPVLCVLLPRGNGTAAGWGALSAGQIATARGKLLEVNRQWRTYAANRPGVILVDWFHVNLNPASTTSDPLVGYTNGDYIHPNAAGAIRLGDYWWSCVKPYMNGGPLSFAGGGDAYSSADQPYGSMFDATWGAGGGTNGAGAASIPAWAGTTAYVAGDLVVTGTRLYRCVIAGTSSAAAPTITSGQVVDGTVTWEYLNSNLTAGVPNGWTVQRSVGASSTISTGWQPRADGLPGNELVLGLKGSDSAEFINFQGAGALTNGNFTAGDAVYLESDVYFDGRGSNQYANPDLFVRWNSAAVQCYAALNAAGAQGDIQGLYQFRLRTPIMVIPSGAFSTHNAWTIDRIKNGGTALVKRRNTVLRKYNKSAPGALTW